MDVVSQLEHDLTQALKDKNELALLTLRQLKTAITTAEISKNRVALSADDVTKVLRAEVKKRREAAELYVQGGRPELAEKEKKEIEIISGYLPPEVSPEIVKQKIAEVIAATGASSVKDIGKVTGQVLKALPGVDGSVVSSLVKAALSAK